MNNKEQGFEGKADSFTLEGSYIGKKAPANVKPVFLTWGDRSHSINNQAFGRISMSYCNELTRNILSKGAEGVNIIATDPKSERKIS